ncbi:MAG: type II secretion system F family protein [Lachnospiraceae bacterium]|nr:type II secretion system F family protein [Lachnospiraceae bacterium]
MGIYQAVRNGFKTGRSLSWQGLTGSFPDKIKAVGLFLLISWLFYDTLWAAALLLPFWKPVSIHIHKKAETRKRTEGEIQFKDFLNFLSASMHAGYAVENAFREAYQELSELYGKNAFIPRELARMLHQMKLNRPAEEVLEEFARRSGLEDAGNFAAIFKIAKRSSGNLVSVMENTSETIGKKLETQREIRTLVQEKRYEQRIMNIMPLAMILYLRMGNGELMEILYTTLAGRAVMTVCLLLCLAAYCLAEKIMNIEI